MESDYPIGAEKVKKQTTLSSGQTVDLPLYTEATITGAIFSASLAPVRTLLPSCLSPVRLGPRTAAVTFLCIEYHRVDEDTFEPYNEFGVLIPATRQSTVSVPFLSRFPDGVGGYVWYLPVTTEPARALGDEIWGYPKVRGDIDITEVDSRRYTTVTIDGDHFITVEIERPPTLSFGRPVPTESYTVQDGTVLREPLSFEGEMGVWPLTSRVSYTLGEHSRAEELRQLDIGDLAVARCYGNGTFVIHPGKPLSH
jgi:hypothetical protein